MSNCELEYYPCVFYTISMPLFRILYIFQRPLIMYHTRFPNVTNTIIIQPHHFSKSAEKEHLVLKQDFCHMIQHFQFDVGQRYICMLT
ncbi:hypothetical protein OIU78_022477 [Salix suchowensis]|nr:hypothetical protein OIU78_022477 [Salix suchowensis]